jgi:Zn-finger nucleic acid-binding protein
MPVCQTTAATSHQFLRPMMRLPSHHQPVRRPAHIEQAAEKTPARRENMKCPTCPDATLAMTDRQGIEIDYCPQCRGVWLDRGELDKLLERAAQPVAATSRTATPPHRDFVDSDFRGGHGHQNRRHKSWLSDIFD